MNQGLSLLQKLDTLVVKGWDPDQAAVVGAVSGAVAVAVWILVPKQEAAAVAAAAAAIFLQTCSRLGQGRHQLGSPSPGSAHTSQGQDRLSGASLSSAWSRTAPMAALQATARITEEGEQEASMVPLLPPPPPNSLPVEVVVAV